MQYIESSIVGLCSAVITLKHRDARLRFMLFPMVHVGERAFFSEVAARARRCQLIVAEAAPSRHTPLQVWMSGIRLDRLVDQLTALDLETLGVPVRWEVTPPDHSGSPARQAGDRILDGMSAIGLRMFGRFGNPLGLPSLEQADDHDDRWEDPGSRLGRFMTSGLIHERDKQLVRTLGEIYQERSADEAMIAVIYGAAHIPAAVDYLIETLGYHVENAEWLTVANARS